MLIPIGFFGAGAAAGAYELIESQVLSTTTTSVTFTSIPQTYKHLQIRFTARSARTGVSLAYAGMRLNSDTAGNYAFHSLNGNGTTVASSAGVTQTRMTVGQMPTVNTTSNIFGAAVVDLLDYTSTSKNTTMRSFSGEFNPDYKYIELNSGVWINTSAVTSVNIFEQSGSGWVSGSRFSLYGIKG